MPWKPAKYKQGNLSNDATNAQNGKSGDAKEIGYLKTGQGSIKYINQHLQAQGKPTIDVSKVGAGDSAETGKLWSAMNEVTGSSEAALVLNKGGTGAYDRYKEKGWDGWPQ